MWTAEPVSHQPSELSVSRWPTCFGTAEFSSQPQLKERLTALFFCFHVKASDTEERVRGLAADYLRRTDACCKSTTTRVKPGQGSA